MSRLWKQRGDEQRGRQGGEGEQDALWKAVVHRFQLHRRMRRAILMFEQKGT
jgi:hypothetical protein